MAKHVRGIAPNGINVRMHNRRITALRRESNEKSIDIEFLNAVENPEEISCQHRVVRGIRVTNLSLSEKAMDEMCRAWIEYRSTFK